MLHCDMWLAVGQHACAFGCTVSAVRVLAGGVRQVGTTGGAPADEPARACRSGGLQRAGCVCVVP